ncbi:hypothetical protein ABIF29_009760 [Bradyrhizobium elkanii]|uniref:Uncharacterized protein n=1 Tax=Bradyrhizobium elkanii TaxID=29448 RepID=A0ABV4FHJ4_BRAEL
MSCGSRSSNARTGSAPSLVLEQLELELEEELVTTASEDELAAQAAAAKTQNVCASGPVRKPSG